MVEKLIGVLGTGIAQGAMIALVSLGYSMVYGILKLINFAHSEVFMMSAFAAFFMIQLFGGESSPLVAGVAGTLAAGLVALHPGVHCALVVEHLALAGRTFGSRGGTSSEVAAQKPSRGERGDDDENSDEMFHGSYFPGCWRWPPVMAMRA